MIFMIEETNLLASVLNLSQGGGGGAVAAVFADCIDELHASIQATVESGQYHPRVEEALTLMKFHEVVRARFKAAYTAGLAKMQQYIDNLAWAVKFYRRLRVFDPRNI